MKQIKPKHCKRCLSYHKGTQTKGSQVKNPKSKHWCRHFGNSAREAVSGCILQNAKRVESDDGEQITTVEVDINFIEGL